jgi:hypothetical protein
LNLLVDLNYFFLNSSKTFIYLLIFEGEILKKYENILNNINNKAKSDNKSNQIIPGAPQALTSSEIALLCDNNPKQQTNRVEYEIIDEDGNQILLSGAEELKLLAESVNEIKQPDGSIIKEYILNDPKLIEQIKSKIEQKNKKNLTEPPISNDNDAIIKNLLESNRHLLCNKKENNDTTITTTTTKTSSHFHSQMSQINKLQNELLQKAAQNFHNSRNKKFLPDFDQSQSLSTSHSQSISNSKSLVINSNNNSLASDTSSTAASKIRTQPVKNCDLSLSVSSININDNSMSKIQQKINRFQKQASETDRLKAPLIPQKVHSTSNNDNKSITKDQNQLNNQNYHLWQQQKQEKIEQKKHFDQFQARLTELENKMKIENENNKLKQKQQQQQQQLNRINKKEKTIDFRKLNKNKFEVKTSRGINKYF